MAVSNGFDTERHESVVETASATTASDNAQSGSGAYIIAGITVVLLLLLGLGLSSCSSIVAHMIEEREEDFSYDYSPYYDEQEYDDFFDWFDDDGYDHDNGYDGNSYGDRVEDEGRFGRLEVNSVLEDQLNMYNATVDSMVSASAYANTQQPVARFVRDLVLADKNATQELTNSLRSVAWSKGDVGSALKDASQQADATIEQLQALELPKAEGEKATDISRELEVGKSKAIDRWKAIKSELELLSQSDEVESSALDDVENQVLDAAEESAENLTKALSDSTVR